MSNETRIVLVRHAKAIRPQGLIYGHTDYPADLSDRRLCIQTTRRLPQSARLISSDLLRCRMTAEMLAGYRRDLVGPTVDARLREQNFGVLEGKVRAEVAPHASSSFWLFDRNERPDNGESFDDVVDRATLLIKETIARNITCVLVTHGNFIRAVLSFVLNLAGSLPARFEIAHWGTIELRHQGTPASITIRL